MDGMDMMDADVLFGTDDEKTFAHQDDLPSLPVPDLDHTLDRYLDSVKPFLSPDEFRQTEFIVQQFRSGIGKELQRKLLEKAKGQRNWLEKWWEDRAYLEGRYPAAPLVNFAGLGPYIYHYFKIKEGTQVERAAFISHFMLKFWQLIRNERLRVDKDMVKGTNFCMNQFYRAFSTCKVPGIQKDTLTYHFKTKSEGPMPTHVVVMYNGRIFTMEAVDNNEEPLTPPEFHLQYQRIKDMCAKLGEGPGLGALTGHQRTNWAKIRSRLLALHPDNYHHLRTIETSLCVVALDENSPRDVSHLYELGLAGDPTNRWFDKSNTLIFFRNGLISSNCDHAPVDAMVQVAGTYYCDLKVKQFKGKWQGDTKVRELKLPEELKFHVDDEILQGVQEAKTLFCTIGENLVCRAVMFKQYGRKFLRSLKLHPDTHVQLVLQYAFYKLHGRPPPTYETATTRQFYHARTETLRSCTTEAVDFAKAMCNKATDPQTKRQLYLRAASRHNKLMSEAKQLQGCDRHLLGLQLIAEEEGLPTPLLYKDEAFTKSGGGGNFALSTSFVGYTTVFGGVSPMLENGYGAFYHIMQESVEYVVTAWKTGADTDADRFAALISEGLAEVAEILKLKPPTAAKL